MVRFSHPAAPLLSHSQAQVCLRRLCACEESVGLCGRTMWQKATDAMHEQLLQRTCGTPPLVYVADLKGPGRYEHKMDHLACFLAGTLALGVAHRFEQTHVSVSVSAVRENKLSLAPVPQTGPSKRGAGLADGGGSR